MHLIVEKRNIKISVLELDIYSIYLVKKHLTLPFQALTKLYAALYKLYLQDNTLCMLT